MQKKFFLVLLGFFVLTAMPMLAQENGGAALFSNDIPKWGVGGFANIAVGSPSFTLVPGISGYYDDVQAGMHFGFVKDAIQFAINGDWFYFNEPLPVIAPLPLLPLSWFAGPGAYLAYGSNFKSYSEVALGLRGIAGVRTMVLGMLDVQAAVVPAFGAVSLGNQTKFNWSIGFEIGVRYAVPLKKGMVIESSRPDTPWTPDGDGVNDALDLAVKIVDDYAVQSWVFEVADSAGQPFYALRSDQPMPDLIQWDGIGTNGEKVISMQNYSYKLTATDKVGISATSESSLLPVDIVLKQDGTDFKLDLTGFVFKPDSPKLADDAASAKENSRLLGSLKACLERMSQYDLTIAGHAVNLSGTAKEEAELVVLSVARADTIKAELQKLGFDASGIRTVGKGGTQPIVPHTDTVNRWKNRRVEFIMTPKGVMK